MLAELTQEGGKPMTTLVGTQKEFVDAFYELCELNYDAVEAYQTAIEKLDDNDYRNKLTEFKNDHDHHLRDICQILKRHNVKAPESSSAKRLLTQGKVVLANLLGDETILRAMLSNEIDTNTAYERLNNRADKWDDAKEILACGLEDGKKHKAWLETILKKRAAA
jgi:rubrerythrin